MPLDLGEIRDRVTGEAAFEQNPVGFGRRRFSCRRGRRFEQGRELWDGRWCAEEPWGRVSRSFVWTEAWRRWDGQRGRWGLHPRRTQAPGERAWTLSMGPRALEEAWGRFLFRFTLFYLTGCLTEQRCPCKSHITLHRYPCFQCRLAFPERSLPARHYVCFILSAPFTSLCYSYHCHFHFIGEETETQSA